MADDVDLTLGPVNTAPEGQHGQGTGRGYPKPVYDYPSWSEGQREVNGRLQHLFRGNVYDAIAPSMSECFKPGFNPGSVNSGNNLSPFPSVVDKGLTLIPGVSEGLKYVRIPGTGPFMAMSAAEDFLEQAMGKQIWDKESPDEKQKWWLENAD